MKDLISKLCSLDGVSGFEAPVRDFIKAYAQPLADEIVTDNAGNLFCFKKGERKPASPIMLCAHMDEVGFLVKAITADGMLKLSPVGSIDPRVLIGRRMSVGKNGIPGIISIKAIHLTTPEERKKSPELKTLYVDIGAKSKEEAEKLVRVGDPIAFRSEFSGLGVDCIKGKALDDRIGCAVLLKLMEEELSYDTWFVFSASEEIGAQGAVTAVKNIDPGFFGIVECTAAGDTPDTPPHLYSTKMRSGGALSLIDRGSVYCRKLREKVVSQADREGVPYQLKLRDTGANDAGSMIYGTGAHLFGLSVPVRYIHCANSVAFMPDIDSALKLARIFIREAGAFDD